MIGDNYAIESTYTNFEISTFYFKYKGHINPKLKPKTRLNTDDIFELLSTSL